MIVGSDLVGTARIAVDDVIDLALLRLDVELQVLDIGNLAAFVRSLIGLSQEAVNEKFGEYLSGNTFNSQQQEFIRTIINYVRENGDVELADMVNSEPFNNYDLNELFGVNLQAIVAIVNVLHNSVVVKAA